MDDLQNIKQALTLAEKGLGQVSPNPMVGAVIVKNGAVVGSGFHRFVDRRHAEAVAIEEAGERARGATIYTNLEPCSHFGRTPPCTEAIIKAGIARVISSMQDPNPKVLGRGFEQLRAAGIEVQVGLFEAEARRLNEVFITYFAKGRPFVHLKTAMSLDGRIATRTGDTQWITGEPAREVVQTLRYRYDAILVGIVTALADNPQLTYRGPRTRHKPLIRVILDSHLRLPLESKLVQTAQETPVWVFTSEDGAAKADQRGQLEELGVRVSTVAALPDPETGQPRLDLRGVLDELGRNQVTSLMVEGGAEVAGSFLTEKLIDKATFFIAPVLIGGRQAISALGGDGFARLDEAPRLLNVEVKHVGRDVMITGYPPVKAE